MRAPLVASAVLVVLGLTLSASPAYGGTICGTVRDAVTAAPVAHAGIFVRTPAGAYTGFHGASDAAGAFCIPGLPAGTYDLEVRVDDYQVAYLRGIEVTATIDVSLPITVSRVWLAPPWPNPALGQVHIDWMLPRAAGTRLLVLDAGGRLVRGWSSRLAAGVHSLSWDLRDSSGRPLGPGCYFVLLEADGVRRVRTFMRTR